MTYTEPLLFICFIILFAALFRIRASGARRVAICAAVAAFLVCWPPVEWLLSLPLIGRYPVRPFQPAPGVEAIVVLGSAIDPARYERPYPVPDINTYRRTEYALWVYRQAGPLPVLACEGRRSRGEPSAMAELLRRGGVPAPLIWLEDRSTNTHENAQFGAAILKARQIRRVALVVDVQSMLRAAACFRKEGIEVVPAPCEFRVLGKWQEEILPGWKAVRRNEITVHELLGLGWYRLRGWT